jgi:enterochelin esterase family protein
VSSAPPRRRSWSAGSGTNRLAINQLQQQDPIDEAAVDRFLASHEVPIVEGRHCTFLFRGEVDEVHLWQRILGLPNRLPMRQIPATTLWYIVLKVPEGSRVNYQLDVRRGHHTERFNDPLNPKLSHSPFGAFRTATPHPSGPFRMTTSHQASSANSSWTAEQCSATVQ